MSVPSLSDIEQAARVIRGVADGTPLIPSPFLTARTGREVLLKLESMQPIGVFKIRGALNALAHLPEDVPGVTCCSTGNHGRGVAFAAKARGLRAVICMSELVPKAKVDGIRALGAEVRIAGRSQDEAETEAARLVAEEGLINVSPFDDPHVIAGQGTIGLELLDTRPDLAAIVVPLSGGGLAGGIALAAKARKPDVRVIGVSMDRGAALYASIRAGQPVPVTEVPSLADSLGGGIGEANRLTLRICSELLDGTHLVTEEEIYRAMQVLYWEDRIIAEGSCAVGLAAMLSGKLDLPDGPVAAIITGRNLSMDLYTKVITGQDVTLGDYTIKGRTYAP